MSWRIIELWFAALLLTLKAVETTVSTIDRLPVAGSVKRRLTDEALDRLLGPAEDFEYVSTTAPSSPPPTY